MDAACSRSVYTAARAWNRVSNPRFSCPEAVRRVEKTVDNAGEAAEGPYLDFRENREFSGLINSSVNWSTDGLRSNPHWGIRAANMSIRLNMCSGLQTRLNLLGYASHNRPNDFGALTDSDIRNPDEGCYVKAN
ncbi:hypothetical protein AVEN_151265-1 [Araneus ventricosus]|uniref:Uncharacterized protein n=1 Tax=Araneus ventricosus TaxID=182803 RepID=A0A4Y2HK34_ARAVE|nr:hypothetical protein AVEN_151265-1 [Araneus ventricosus]